MDRISILIADDEQTVLDTLAAVVGHEPDLEVVAQARDASTAIELASQEQPDVAILDVRMPGGGGPRAAREIIRRSPPTRVLALSAHEDATTVLAMLRAGALGYVVKGDSTQEIIDAIHRCLREEPTLSGVVTNDLAHALADGLHRVTQGSRLQRDRHARVRRVLDGNRLSMVFQPIVDLKDGTVAGVEALARIATRPTRPPDEWFAEAAAVGLLLELELAAINTAVSQLGSLPESCYMSLNISPETIGSPELGDALESVPLDRLVLEVTEHAPVDDYEALTDTLSSFRERGLRVAVDDAGAGFASLRHIVRLSPDLVKLDITLIRNIDGDEVRRAVVAALVAFASQIGAKIVAEGVETAEELAALRTIGVRFAQGFHLGLPGSISGGISGGWGRGRPGGARSGGARASAPSP
jgi:EAL domain-containing protein (putative c-di-GMP-specific phosphodiesterase class I)/ActR/RegA family two-component response regulator